MSGDTPDFEDTTYGQTTSEGAANIDVSLADLKTLLESLELNVVGRLDTDLSEVLSELVTIEGLTVPSAPMQPITFAPLRYRTGSVILWEDFELGNGYWYTYTNGTGAASALDTTNWLRGGQSWKLTAGSDGAYQARLMGYFGRHDSSARSIEYVFSHDENEDKYSLYFEPCVGAEYWRYAVKFDITNDQISIRDENGAYQVIRDPMALIGGAGVFHYIKLTVDIDTEKYTALIVNEEEIDISAYSCATGSVSADTYWEIRWVFTGTGGDNPVMRIDCIALIDED